MVSERCAFCEREKPPAWWPRYPTPHQATRIAAFVIAARLEAEREALA